MKQTTGKTSKNLTKNQELSAATITPAKISKFLNYLALSCDTKKSALKAKIDLSQLYRMRRDTPELRTAWEVARTQAMEQLEDEAFRRAVFGTKKELAHQGIKTGDYLTEYSDRLLIKLMEGNIPSKYRADGGTQVNVNITEAAGVLELAHIEADKLRLEGKK